MYAILRRPTSGDLYFKRDYKSVILDKLKRKEFLYVYYMPYHFMYMHFYHKKVLLIIVFTNQPGQTLSLTGAWDQ